MAVPPYLGICQNIAFLIAIFSNSLLLYLIKIRADNAFGRYRTLMKAFSIYSIVYATVEILTQPVTHIHGSGSMFCVDSFLKEYYTIGIIIASVYCGMFAMCISVLAAQFIYRYIAVCNQWGLYYFERKPIFLWFIFPFLLFFLDAFSMFMTTPTNLKRDYFRSTVLENYGENIDEIPFLGPLYFSLCFGTCVFCAYKTYKSLNDSSVRMSARYRALNKQLFWTLFLQTLLPCCTQYIPVWLIFILPFFEVNVGRCGSLVGVVCSLYPALDPLIAIFMIDRFRNYIFGNNKVSARNRSKSPTL